MEVAIQAFHNQFPDLYQEKLLTCKYYLSASLTFIPDYVCTVWYTYPHQGTLYVTENYLTFQGSSDPDLKIVIAFKDVLAITKESLAMGLLHNSIKITSLTHEAQRY